MPTFHFAFEKENSGILQKKPAMSFKAFTQHISNITLLKEDNNSCSSFSIINVKVTLLKYPIFVAIYIYEQIF